MKIIPAIDILDGKCVRLTKGEFDTKKVYSDDLFSVAKGFKEQGAKIIHIIDLDAAKTGKPTNQELILKIVEDTGINVEVGGGIRDIETARRYLNNGVQKVVIGTRAVTDPDFITSLIKEFGNSRIIIAIEVRNDIVAINGWQDNSSKKYLDFAKELSSLGVTEILFTDVDKDGSLTEPNFESIKKLIDLKFNIIASGGISNIESIRVLKDLGANAVILGKSLYENRISLKEVLDEFG